MSTETLVHGALGSLFALTFARAAAVEQLRERLDLGTTVTFRPGQEPTRCASKVRAPTFSSSR